MGRSNGNPAATVTGYIISPLKYPLKHTHADRRVDRRHSQVVLCCHKSVPVLVTSPPRASQWTVGGSLGRHTETAHRKGPRALANGPTNVRRAAAETPTTCAASRSCSPQNADMVTGTHLSEQLVKRAAPRQSAQALQPQPAKLVILKRSRRVCVYTRGFTQFHGGH